MINPNQSNKHVCQIFLNGFYCIFSRRFQNCQIVWCGMSEICLKLIVLAQIVFLTFLGVEYAKNIGVRFFPPLNLVLWHIQYGRHRNHISGHNLGSSIARVTILMSIPMYLGMSNPTVPIKMWMSLRYIVINDKTHFWYVFGHFFSRILKKQIQTSGVV